MYLTPQMVGNAELTLGGVDSTKFTGRLPFKPCPFKIKTIALGTPRYASLASHNSDWSLTSPGLSVNGKTNSILTKSRNIIFDSGTSNVLFSTDTAEVHMVDTLNSTCSCAFTGNVRPHFPRHQTESTRTRDIWNCLQQDLISSCSD